MSVPSHRYTPLKDNWANIYTPVVEKLKLQIRFNLKTRNVEIKVRIITDINRMMNIRIRKSLDAYFTFITHLLQYYACFFADLC